MKRVLAGPSGSQVSEGSPGYVDRARTQGLVTLDHSPVKVLDGRDQLIKGINGVPKLLASGRVHKEEPQHLA